MCLGQSDAALGLTADRRSAQLMIVKGRGQRSSITSATRPRLRAPRHRTNGPGKALFRQSVELSCFYDRLMLTHFLFLFAFGCFVEGNRLMQMLSNGTLACTVKCLILILRNYI